MTSGAPSWADQWGAGGIGALEEDDNAKSKKDTGTNKKADGLAKAKAAAFAGLLKMKIGTSNGFKWLKNQCHKKNTTSSK